MENPTLAELAAKWIVIAVLIERAVDWAKALVRTDLRAKPWPLISGAIGAMIAYRYALGVLEGVLHHGPTRVLPIIGTAPVLDWLLTTAVFAGGASGIVSIYRKIMRYRKELSA